MTMKRIVVEAEKAGLETISISDHLDSAREEKLLENFVLRDKWYPAIDVKIGCEVSQMNPLLSRLETIQLRRSILS